MAHLTLSQNTLLSEKQKFFVHTMKGQACVGLNVLLVLPDRPCRNGSKKANELPPLSSTLDASQDAEVLELDELWSFVGSKANKRWIWIALCRRTHQIVSYFIRD